ncbi:MAG: hypothetical protein SGJ13_03975 [Actinomycetota bacterium]|nr:hypothetical protein [Actinomycetota bacterium]
MTSDPTRPSKETRAAERSDAETIAGPDDMPTPEEEETADRAGAADEKTKEHYEEMAERGANQQGEGRTP